MDYLQDIGDLNPSGEIKQLMHKEVKKVRMGRLFMGNQGTTILSILKCKLRNPREGFAQQINLTP